MDFQWDSTKERKNRHKHGIAFADALSVLRDDRAITIDDDHPDEERYIYWIKFSGATFACCLYMA